MGDYQAYIDFFKNNKDAIIAFGVFFTAIASILAAYMTSRAQRKNFIGQLRAQWIEYFRSDMAEFINIIPSMLLSRIKNIDLTDNYDDPFYKYHLLGNKIRLYLNEAEPENKKIVDIMIDIDSAFKKEDNDREVFIMMDNLREATQVVLRKEWKRAAKGKI